MRLCWGPNNSKYSDMIFESEIWGFVGDEDSGQDILGGDTFRSNTKGYSGKTH
jgi:hypothetical protein